MDATCTHCSVPADGLIHCERCCEPGCSSCVTWRPGRRDDEPEGLLCPGCGGQGEPSVATFEGAEE